MNRISLPFSRAAIEAGELRGTALISIGPSEAACARVSKPTIPDGHFDYVLRLSFDDIPCLSYVDHQGMTWSGPTERDVTTSLDFSRRNGADAFIAVHCEQGRSRSAAIALAITADRLGPRQEAEAVRQLLDGDTEEQRCFNPLIVRLADRLLVRQGAIEAALESKCRPFVTWRRYWINKGVLPLYGLPADVPFT